MVDVLAVRILIPTAATGAALFAAGQHVLFHKVPVLWRLHRMHHADLDVDVSSKLANQLGVDYTHDARSQEFGR